MQTENVELRTIVLTCANTLLTSLLSLTGSPSAAQISDTFVEKINLLYDDLESCDYIGNAILESPIMLLLIDYSIRRCSELPDEITHAQNLRATAQRSK